MSKFPAEWLPWKSSPKPLNLRCFMTPRCLLSSEVLCVFQTSEWRLSYINKEFTVCPSYPPTVIVPKSIDDEALRKVAAFRHGGRFPVLSYYHKKNGMVSMRGTALLLTGVAWGGWVPLLGGISFSVCLSVEVIGQIIPTRASPL